MKILEFALIFNEIIVRTRYCLILSWLRLWPESLFQWLAVALPWTFTETIPKIWNGGRNRQIYPNWRAKRRKESERGWEEGRKRYSDWYEGERKEEQEKRKPVSERGRNRTRKRKRKKELKRTRKEGRSKRVKEGGGGERWGYKRKAERERKRERAEEKTKWKTEMKQ